MPNLRDTLANHNAIGWDIDGTLVGNPAAPLFRDYILSNPSKRHCLVTFRTHDLVDRIKGDLFASGFYDMAVFDKALTVPEDIWMQWAVLQRSRTSGKTVGKLLLPETTYMEWKGFICRQEGLTALVDDDLTNTERGCKRFGVELIDATKFV